MTTLDLLEIAELFYNYFKSFLYFPVISPYLEPILHQLPNFVWNLVEAMCGFDMTFHIDLAELPMMARNDVGGTSSKNMMHWI